MFAVRSHACAHYSCHIHAHCDTCTQSCSHLLLYSHSCFHSHSMLHSCSHTLAVRFTHVCTHRDALYIHTQALTLTLVVTELLSTESRAGNSQPHLLTSNYRPQCTQHIEGCLFMAMGHWACLCHTQRLAERGRH